jgi:predicted nuclease with TOPRIM domain
MQKVFDKEELKQELEKYQKEDKEINEEIDALFKERNNLEQRLHTIKYKTADLLKRRDNIAIAIISRTQILKKMR